MDLIFCAMGNLPVQADCMERSGALAAAIWTNFTVPALLINQLLSHLRNGGCLGVVSSVAADRGRQSNFVYGSAKAGLGIYLEGLRHALFERRISVIEFKPGFVDSPMTAHLKKNFLFTSAEKAAQIMARNIEKSENSLQSSIVYVPGYWRIIMLVIKSLPNFLFWRSKL